MGLTDDFLFSAGAQVGLAQKDLAACLGDPDMSARVQAHLTEYRGLGFRGTPRFVIGTLDRDRRLVAKELVLGSRPLDEFTKIFAKLD